MSDFIMDSAALESVCGKLESLSRELERVNTLIGHEKKTLLSFSGFGIDKERSNLNLTQLRIAKCSQYLTSERESLNRIIQSVRDYENKAYGIISGENVEEFKDYEVIGEPAEKKKTYVITHKDWEKLMNQFKYYSTQNDTTAGLYKMLEDFYDMNKDIEMTYEDYHMLKDTFNYLIHKDDHGAYSYTEVKIPDGKIEPDGDFRDGDVGVSADGSIVSMTYACGYDGDTSEYTLKFLTGSGKIELGAELLSIKAKDMDMKKFFKELEKSIKSSNKDAISYTLAQLGLSGKIEVKGIELAMVTTVKINDDISYYTQTTATIGDAYAKAEAYAGVGSDGLEVKAAYGVGASAAKVETKHGIKTNDGTYGIEVGLNAGVKAGGEAALVGKKKNLEVDAGYANGGIFADEGFDFYTWED